MHHFSINIFDVELLVLEHAISIRPEEAERFGSEVGRVPLKDSTPLPFYCGIHFLGIGTELSFFASISNDLCAF